MNIKKTLDKAKLAMSETNLQDRANFHKLVSFKKLTNALNIDDIQYSDTANASLKDIILLLRKDRIEKFGTEDITPEMAESDFLACMEQFRTIGNRNIYNNTCTVFTPPSGYPYNEEVSNTYYYMYEGALDSSKAFNLLTAMVDASLDYAIGGGSKNMFEWMVEVGKAVAVQEWHNEHDNPEEVLEPTITYLANQSYQSPLAVAYVFG